MEMGVLMRARSMMSASTVRNLLAAHLTVTWPVGPGLGVEHARRIWDQVVGIVVTRAPALGEFHGIRDRPVPVNRARSSAVDPGARWRLLGHADLLVLEHLANHLSGCRQCRNGPSGRQLEQAVRGHRTIGPLLAMIQDGPG